MDGFLFFLFVCLVIYVILIDRRRRDDAEEHKQATAALTSRIYALEQQQAKAAAATALAGTAARPAETATPVAARPVTLPATPPRPVPPAVPAVTPAAHPEVRTASGIPMTPSRVEPAPMRPSTPPPQIPAAHQTAAASAGPMSPVMHAPAPSVTTSSAPFSSFTAKPAAAEKRKAFTQSVEDALSTNWLPKVGITILVLGVSLLTASYWEHIPHFGRILLVYLVGGGLLAGGIVLEPKENFKVLGRGLIGGGWSIIFFATYAMRHIDAARILNSDVTDLFLMLAVAGVMVWHTLKYDSQLVTGFSFLLGFVAVNISHETAFSMAAGAVLALGMTFVVLRRQWFELEVFGILASYLNHFYWLYTIFEAHGRTGFTERPASIALMVSYWIIFRASYLLRKVSGKEQEALSTVAALLNAFLFLGVMKYQSFHTGWAFWALLAMGAIEFTLGQLPVSRGRRAPFQVLSSLGAALMVAAVPIKFAGSHGVELLWLAGAEAFLLAGILTKERLFRHFGGIISFIVAAYVFLLPTGILYNIGQIIAGRPHHDPQLSIIVAGIACVFYLNSHVIGLRWKDLFQHGAEQQAMSALSFIASIFAVTAVYCSVSAQSAAVVVALLFAGLSFAGQRFHISDLIYQAHWIAMVAIADVSITGLDLKSRTYNIPDRIISFGAVSGLLYLSSRFVRLSKTAGAEAFVVFYRWAATALLALLIWLQAPVWLTPVYWVALGLLVALAGHFLKRNEFKWQASALAAISVVYALAINFGVTGEYHHVSYRAISVLLIAAGVYAMARWSPSEFIRPGYSWAGSFLLSWLAWYELQPNSIALAWAGLGLVLFEIGYERLPGYLRIQGYVALAASFARIFYANINSLSPTELFNSATLSILPLAPMYFWVYWRLHSKQSQGQAKSEFKLAHLLAAMGTAALAALVRFEMLPENVAVGYAGLAVALLTIAWLLRQQVFLYQGLILAGVTAFRLSMRNFYDLHNSLTSSLPSSIIAIALLSIGIPVAFRLRTTGDDKGTHALLRRPEQPMFFISVALMTILLAIRMPAGMITLAWGIEGIAVFLLALLAKERSFRLTGLALLVLCVGKIIFMDVWNLADPRARYLTLIGVGAILLVVSYLYGRKREALREYL